MCVSSGLWHAHIMSAFSQLQLCQHCFIGVILNVFSAATYKSFCSQLHECNWLVTEKHSQKANVKWFGSVWCSMIDSTVCRSITLSKFLNQCWVCEVSDSRKKSQSLSMEFTITNQSSKPVTHQQDWLHMDLFCF